MTQLEAAALWVGLNALFLIVLSARVGMNRIARKIDLGDGGVPEMTQAIRAHGNYIEYAPAALGAIVLLALLGIPVWAVHLLGGLFSFARVAHWLGLGLGAWAPGRPVGVALTMLTLLIAGVWLVYLAVF